MESVNTLIKSRRKSKGFTQKQLAQHLGIEERTYQYYEADREPDLTTLKKIAEKLNVTIAELLGEQPVREDINNDFRQEPDPEMYTDPIDTSDAGTTVKPASDKNQPSNKLEDTVKVQAQTILLLARLLDSKLGPA